MIDHIPPKLVRDILNAPDQPDDSSLRWPPRLPEGWEPGSHMERPVWPPPPGSDREWRCKEGLTTRALIEDKLRAEMESDAAAARENDDEC